MGNICANLLHVSGPESEVARFKNKAVSTELKDDGQINEHLTFENFHPTPEGLLDSTNFNTDEYDVCYGEGFSDLYELGRNNYGIKSEEELYAFLVENHPTFLEIANKAKSLVDAYGYPNVHQWHYAEWGTIWDAYDSNILTDEPTLIRYDFTTDTKPPSVLLELISKEFPELYFKLTFEEHRWDGTGYIIYEHGKLIESVFTECWQGLELSALEEIEVIHEDDFDFEIDSQPYGYVTDPDQEAFTEDKYNMAVSIARQSRE